MRTKGRRRKESAKWKGVGSIRSEVRDLSLSLPLSLSLSLSLFFLLFLSLSLSLSSEYISLHFSFLSTILSRSPPSLKVVGARFMNANARQIESCVHAIWLATCNSPRLFVSQVKLTQLRVCNLATRAFFRHVACKRSVGVNGDTSWVLHFEQRLLQNRVYSRTLHHP